MADFARPMLLRGYLRAQGVLRRLIAGARSRPARTPRRSTIDAVQWGLDDARPVPLRHASGNAPRDAVLWAVCLAACQATPSREREPPVAVNGATTSVAASAPGESSAAPVPQPSISNDEVFATRYVELKATLMDEAAAPTPEQLDSIEHELRAMTNAAGDRHLRANAGLLLGSLYERRGRHADAIAFYRHASKLVPDDAGPFMALATALAAPGDHRDVLAAAVAQAEAARLDPDNLENWLALGELRLKVGDDAGAAKAYAAYEMRRKGLIEGLTARKDGEFVVAANERAECASALASASDNGTALALLYAFEHESEAVVRTAIARTMGVQRLAGYREALSRYLEGERDPNVREALTWALAEVTRDPVETRPGPAPLKATDGKDAVPSAPGP